MTPVVTVTHKRTHVQNYDQNDAIFPCNHPVHQHMRSSVARENTFASWPGRIAVTNEEMAEAGLFYTGIGDKTKCFYCSGGLENWEYDDEPMVEHAKFYPQCEFVLRKRGAEFVSFIAGEFPYLNRPPLPGSSFITTSRNGVTISNTSTVYHGASCHFQNAEEIQPRPSRQNKLENALKHELTNAMKSFGYTEALLKRVIERRLQTAEMFETASQFLDAIQDMENVSNSPVSRTPAPSSMPEQSQGQEAQCTESSVEIRLKEISDERRCKICLDHETECVFSPCGHICTCMDCASRLRSCPICRKRISSILKFYAA